MTIRKIRDGVNSAYVAFKDDRERKWALVSRDIRLVLVIVVLALGEVAPVHWQALLRLISGG